MSSRTPGRIGVINPEEFPKTLPSFEGYTVPGLKSIVGPTDPLKGADKPDDVSGLAEDGIIGLLEKILIGIRAVHPTSPIQIKGGIPLLTAGTGDTYKFFMNNRPIPAMNVLVQNNTGALVYVGIDEQPSQMGIQLATGQTLQIADVDVHWISLFTTNQAWVNGLTDTKTNPTPTQLTNCITIYAWSNPEWYNVWGMTS